MANSRGSVHDPVVVVMLDPEQDPNEAERGRPHHIERLVNDLKPAFRKRVFGLYLPEGTDPGSLDRYWMFRRIREEAEKRGLEVSFGRNARY
jgi:hypothetical protein